MIQFIHNADTAVIVIHEIYGINAHMQQLCGMLAARQVDVYCPNLLDRDMPYSYEQEEEAYANFMTNVGFAQAKGRIEQLVDEVRGSYKHLFVVGSSVGATVAWLCSEHDGISGIVGYYGSRIRSFATITPRIPTLLFFAEEEKSFHVPSVAAELNRKSNVSALVLPGRHGFGDPYSPNYMVQSAAESHHRMLDFMKQMTCEIRR
ncbi:dienelactone hydrolase family protein [Paenibacillus aurantiacus]|uniref:Dienelactone hydrolase family protein n=1 Tax=Paenibacillus aurantiacus TaxID=1936118 RepID=A0ABV5KU67_9BACL